MGSCGHKTIFELEEQKYSLPTLKQKKSFKLRKKNMRMRDFNGAQFQKYYEDLMN